VAVDWAVAEAERRQLPLTVLYVFDQPNIFPGMVTPVGWVDVAQKAAQEVTAQGVARARTTATTIDIRSETRIDRAAFTLIESSRDAALLVLGTRGHGNVAGTLLGSIAFAVTAHAFCPVVVVRGDRQQLPGPNRPILVAVDGSPGSDAAVRYAVDVASGTKAAVTMLTAYQGSGSQIWAEADLYTEDKGGPSFGTVAEQAAGTVAADAVRTALDLNPLVEVTARVVEGASLQVLISAAADYGLLVMGARGHGGFAGLRLGSISHGAICSAPCPVTVVPSPTKLIETEHALTVSAART
jgi:nucleotide-binding universal stress UspA family protein